MWVGNARGLWASGPRTFGSQCPAGLKGITNHGEIS